MKFTSKIKQLFTKLFSNKASYLLLLASTFVVCRLGTWLYPFDSDHWIFYYVGSDWFHGGQLYLTAWDHKPPLIFAINGLMSLFFGSNIVLHRIFFTAVAAVSIYLFYCLLKFVIPNIGIKNQTLAIRFGTWIFTLWASLSQFTSSGNNNENFGLPAFIAMLILYFGYHKSGSLWRLFGAGACLSVLFFLKGNFLLLAAPIGIFIIAENYKDFWKVFRDGFVFGLPLIIQGLVWVLYFVYQGRLNDFFVATFQFSAKYSSSAWIGQLSQLKLFYTLVALASPLIIFTTVAMWLCLRRSWKNFYYDYFAVTLLFGSLAFFAVGVPYLYYFLILFPVYVIALIYLLFSDNGLRGLSRVAFILLFAAGTVLNFGFMVYELVQTNRGAVQAEAAEYQEIASYVKANTTADDKVFAYDYGATFYQLAQRKSGSRYISASVLLLDYRGDYGFKLDDTFIAEMEKSKAKYVVAYKDTKTLYYQNLPIVGYFDTHYQKEKIFNKFVLLRRK